MCFVQFTFFFLWLEIENVPKLRHFELHLWKKGRKYLKLFRYLRISYFQGFSKIARKKIFFISERVKETVRKCRISQKSWWAALCIRNFRDKNGDAWKSFDFFDTQIKTPRTSDYACSRESTLRSVPLLPFDAIRLHLKILMQILY